MKYVTELRDGRLAQALSQRIHRRITRPWTLMEICGGQTHTIMKYGLTQLLPDKVRLVHGPGCPVCVTPLEIIDTALDLAARPNVIFVSYGDMLRVPGSTSDLRSVRAQGGDVRVVCTPMAALDLAKQHPDHEVIFFAIGFETTAPAHAMTVRAAQIRGLENFSMLVSHVLVPPAIQQLLDDPDCDIDGLIAPGHVCAITGHGPYEALSRTYRVPFVVGGFEPVDLLEAIGMLVDQLEDGRTDVENQYARAVNPTGNRHARAILEEVFEVCDQPWRGLGTIRQSGLSLRHPYCQFDARRRFSIPRSTPLVASKCWAGEVLQGKRLPPDCPAFGTTCTPSAPLGAPMVSTEGACAAYFRFSLSPGEPHA